MKKGNCSVRIGRISCTHGNDYVRISVSDESSGMRVVDVNMTLEQFALAVTSLHLSDVPCEYGALDRVGLQHECKHVHVVVDNNKWTSLSESDWDDYVLQCLREQGFESDGWISDRPQHNYRHLDREKSTYRVIMRRWVERKE